MELNSSIYDYNFHSGDRAQYTYMDASEEKILSVKVLDSKVYPDGKLYVISAHPTSLEIAGLAIDEILSNHYFNDMQLGYKAALVDPDELDPYLKQFKIIVDNTRGKQYD